MPARRGADIVEGAERMWGMKLETLIVRKLLDDLTDRRGLKHEWHSIDKEVQKEIIRTWIKIVRQCIAERLDS